MFLTYKYYSIIKLFKIQEGSIFRGNLFSQNLFFGNNKSLPLHALLYSLQPRAEKGAKGGENDIELSMKLVCLSL